MDRAKRRRNRLCLAGLIASGWFATSAWAMDFAPSLTAARAAGDATRPVVVTFTAPWCGWCRKMATTTFPDPQVEAVADQYLWVKLDPETDPALAARLRVHGLPHTVLLDAQDRVLGSQPGYMTPAALVQFLAESAANPQPLEGVAQSLLEGLADLKSAEMPAETVRQAVELLARQPAEGRDAVLDAVRAAGPAAYPHLIPLLNDERLAVRAAAGFTLQRLTQAELACDPFATPEARQEQMQAWTRWIAERP